MSRALALPARQVTALCKGAAKAGCIAEVKIGDTWKRLDEVFPATDVYVIRCGQYVKIGKTAHLASRLAALRTATPYELEVVSVISADDGDELEVELHKRFARYRHRGEWFRSDGWLANWISRGCPV